MSQFEKSQWANNEFSQNYRDDADVFLPFRHQFIEVTKSLYAHFFGTNSGTRVLDLGCGDGMFVQELLKSFSPVSLTLIDGSAEMLEAAKNRLGTSANIKFIKASFQELLSSEPLNDSFDFVYSSLAIHHLPFTEKKRLFTYIYNLLPLGGCFVHYDVVASRSEKIEKWYLASWRQWIKGHPAKNRAEKLLGIPDQYKENQDNIPDTLELQLETLKAIGFKDVDCHFKYGIFSLFGGFK